MSKAIYAGSFDPITNGHIDILKRGLKVFDEVVVLIANNSSKNSRFSLEEKKQMVEEALKDLNIKGASVDTFDGLVVNYAKRVGATHMIRGLRAVSDFEYEFKLSAANEYIDDSIDIVFFMAHNETNFISSSAINEMFDNNVDISKLVPDSVTRMYQKKK